MAQWGEERTFTKGDATIRCLPDLETQAAFDPTDCSSTVTSVLLVNTQGCRAACLALHERVSQDYTGQRYADWLTDPDVE